MAYLLAIWISLLPCTQKQNDDRWKIVALKWNEKDEEDVEENTNFPHKLMIFLASSRCNAAAAAVEKDKNPKRNERT